MGPARSREDSPALRSARERDRRRRRAAAQVGEHHPPASDTYAEPDAYSHAVALCVADRFSKPFAIARGFARSVACANLRLPAAVTERLAVSRSIAKAEPESSRERDAVAEPISITVGKILRLAQKEEQQLAL